MSLCTSMATSYTVWPRRTVNGRSLSGGRPGAFVYTRTTPRLSNSQPFLGHPVVGNVIALKETGQHLVVVAVQGAG